MLQSIILAIIIPETGQVKEPAEIVGESYSPAAPRSYQPEAGKPPPRSRTRH